MEQAGDGKVIPLPMESINNKVGWLPRNWGVVSEDTGIGNRVTIAILHQLGTTESCTITVGM